MNYEYECIAKQLNKIDAQMREHSSLHFIVARLPAVLPFKLLEN